MSQSRGEIGLSLLGRDRREHHHELQIADDARQRITELVEDFPGSTILGEDRLRSLVCRAFQLVSHCGSYRAKTAPRLELGGHHPVAEHPPKPFSKPLLIRVPAD